MDHNACGFVDHDEVFRTVNNGNVVWGDEFSGGHSAKTYAMPAVTEVEAKTEMPVDVATGFRWHERPAAFERLVPPWQDVTLQNRTGGIEDGAVVTLGVRKGGLSLPMVVEHYGYQKNARFCDRQVKGPFRSYEHEHLFVKPDAEPDGGTDASTEGRTAASQGFTMRDVVRFQPQGCCPLDRWRQTYGDCFGTGTRCCPWTSNALPGSGKARDAGWCSRALRAWWGPRCLRSFRCAGYDVVQLVRRPTSGAAKTVARPKANAPGAGNSAAGSLEGGVGRLIEARWDPRQGVLDAAALEGAIAVVHLSGANVAGGRWTAARKEELRESRIATTALMVSRMREMETPPPVLVCASGIGIYGVGGEDVCTEDHAVGDDFMAQLAVDWEAAANKAADFGTRVVNLRLGAVLSEGAGMLGRLAPLFATGLGGPVGDGTQPLAWVQLEDVLSTILFSIHRAEVTGPLNVIAPGAELTHNRDFTAALGRVLHRPAVLPAPGQPCGRPLGKWAKCWCFRGPEPALRSSMAWDFSSRFLD